MNSSSTPPGNAVPTEFQLFPYGSVQIEGGPSFSVDDLAMSSIISRFKSRGLDMVVDYEHQTEGNGLAPAAGWITGLINRGRYGLWAAVQWTAKGREYLSAKEYRYFSPVFRLSKGNNLTEILRVAITNNPRLNCIRPIVASMSFLNQAGLEFGIYKEITAAEIHKEAECPEETQKFINKLLGLSDEVFAKHAPQSTPGAAEPTGDLQRAINQLCGITDETWAKYGPSQVQ